MVYNAEIIYCLWGTLCIGNTITLSNALEKKWVYIGRGTSQIYYYYFLSALY